MISRNPVEYIHKILYDATAKIGMIFIIPQRAADVNADDKIGMAEAVYIMEILSGTRFFHE